MVCQALVDPTTMYHTGPLEVECEPSRRAVFSFCIELPSNTQSIRVQLRDYIEYWIDFFNPRNVCLHILNGLSRVISV